MSFNLHHNIIDSLWWIVMMILLIICQNWPALYLGEHESDGDVSYGDGDNAGYNADDDDDRDDDVNHLANSAGSLSPGTWGRQQGA